MQFGELEITDLIQQIWQSFLGMEVTPGSKDLKPNGTESYLTGCVQITGAWQGAVTLDCEEDLAKILACIMFEKKPEDLSKDDIRDALGELTNQIGGNVKCLLPTPCFLSMPSVTHGEDYSVKIPGSTQLSRIPFDCQGNPILVTLLEKTVENK